MYDLSSFAKEASGCSAMADRKLSPFKALVALLQALANRPHRGHHPIPSRGYNTLHNLGPCDPDPT